MPEAITITWTNAQQALSLLIAAAAVVLLRLSFSMSKPESLSMPAVATVAILWAMAFISEDAVSAWASRIGLFAIAGCAIRVAWTMAVASAAKSRVSPLRVALDDWTGLRESSLWLAVCLGLLDQNRMEKDGEALLAKDNLAEELGDMLRQLVRLGILEARYHGAEFRWARPVRK